MRTELSGWNGNNKKIIIQVRGFNTFTTRSHDYLLFSHMIKKYLISLVLLITVSVCFSQISKDEHQNCLDNHKIESGFIAITTHENSDLAEWYQNSFGMEQVKYFESADGNSRGVILRKDKFVVEIIFRRDLVKRKAVRPQVKNEEWDGLLKFGVYTDANLLELKDCLLRNGINAGRIFKDKELKEDLLLVRDPEGNMMELISRSPLAE